MHANEHGSLQIANTLEAIPQEVDGQGNSQISWSIGHTSHTSSNGRHFFLSDPKVYHDGLGQQFTLLFHFSSPRCVELLWIGLRQSAIPLEELRSRRVSEQVLGLTMARELRDFASPTKPSGNFVLDTVRACVQHSLARAPVAV